MVLVFAFKSPASRLPFVPPPNLCYFFVAAPSRAFMSTEPTPKPKPEPPSESSPWRLGFWALIAPQFQTAFNDYGVQWVVIYLVVATNFSHRARDKFMLVVGALLAIPFLL